jgi:hypothetical protein
MLREGVAIGDEIDMLFMPSAHCEEFLRTRVYTPTSGLNFGQVYRPPIGAKSGFTPEPVLIFSVPTYIFGGVEDWRIKLG